jgi:hypothetical protein
MRNDVSESRTLTAPKGREISVMEAELRGAVIQAAIDTVNTSIQLKRNQQERTSNPSSNKLADA